MISTLKFEGVCKILCRYLSVSFFLAMFAAAPAAALDAYRSIDQFSHTEWGTRDGAPSTISGIAQSTDGFLWLAGSDGLFRFDGSRFEQIGGPNSISQRSVAVISVLATRSGDVWAGYEWGGSAVYHNGTLTAFNRAKPWGAVRALAETPDGAVWLLNVGSKGGVVVRYKAGRWTTIGARWSLPANLHLLSMTTLRDGMLALVDAAGIYTLRPGASRFQFEALPGRLAGGLAQDRMGSLWLADADGFWVRRSGRDRFAHVLPTKTLNSMTYHRIIFDREGGLWTTGDEHGLVRVRTTDLLLQPNDLTRRNSALEIFTDPSKPNAYVPTSVFEDRDGNVWVGSMAGLERFRRSPIARTALPGGRLSALYRDVIGGVYAATSGGLYKLEGRTGPTPFIQARDISSSCSNGRGVVATTPWRILYRFKGRIIVIPPPASPMPGFAIMACAYDGSGRLVISVARAGVFRRDKSGWERLHIDPARPFAAPISIVPDALGRLILVFPLDDVLRLDGDKVERLWRRKDVTVGFIRLVKVDGPELYFCGEGGLARFSGGTVSTLSADRYPWLARASGIARARDGWTWITTRSGIVRVATRDLNSAFDHPGTAIPYRIFGQEDGIRGDTDLYSSDDAFQDRTGQLWFFTSVGLITIDPARIVETEAAPPIAIRSVQALGRTYPPLGTISLPKGATDLEIDYAAVALTNPDATTFRYRLIGNDNRWIDAARRTQAFYTNLSPGRYKFEVISVSATGMPSPAPATIAITIPPTFFQSRLFLLICVLAVAGLFWFLYILRLRVMAAQIRNRVRARSDERERIARELHDTLLQGVQGLLLRFHVIAQRISREDSTRQAMEDALDAADKVLVEGRDRVHELRTKVEPDDLSRRLRAVADLRNSIGDSPAIDVRCVGDRRDLAHEVCEQLVRLAEQAIANAIQHARAHIIDVEVRYLDRELQLAISDDGVGLSAEVLQNGARRGRYGLIGMRERAKQVKGRLQLHSAPQGGTKIVVSVPAREAYAGGRRSMRWF